MEFEIYRGTEMNPRETREINTIEDLRQVTLDYQNGKFGKPNNGGIYSLVELVVGWQEEERDHNQIIIYDTYLE